MTTFSIYAAHRPVGQLKSYPKTISAYAAHQPGGQLEPFTYEVGELAPEEVEVKVDYCGLCHSDLSMLNNDWEITEYPLVPGHEVIGIVAAVGTGVTTLEPGQRVGIGWNGETCGTCEYCQVGDENLCGEAQPLIMRPPGNGGAQEPGIPNGGFASHVRAHQNFVFPIPEVLASEAAGPLLCGGATVFNAIVQAGVKPTDRVGVIGLGGLGHMAVEFLVAWGCEVTVFSSSPAKAVKAKELGATDCVNSRDGAALAVLADKFNFIFSTVNVELPWSLYLGALHKKGQLLLVGVAPGLNLGLEDVFELMMGQKSIGSSPDCSPSNITQMLNFAAQHNIQPEVEVLPLVQVNAAIAKLRNEKPAGRIVLRV
ncbi:MAG: NAD(P)-dependent alcohol dehydrogenase [Spirulina sp. SIO3F2]|nr:NAD(P)-dependent alcohol dehydrogenase [Spirulina sp. SIO3F2]